jgi:hypothetical protein
MKTTILAVLAAMDVYAV